MTVSHPTLLEELAAFRKAELLQALRTVAAGTTIHDIRFRVGPVDVPETLPAGPSPPRVSEQPPSSRGGKTPGRNARQRNRSRTRGNDHGPAGPG